MAAPIVQLDADVRSMALRQMAEQAEEAMSPLIVQGLVDVQLGEGRRDRHPLRHPVRLGAAAWRRGAGCHPHARRCAHGIPEQHPGARAYRQRAHRTAVFRPNWELSAARAASVVHIMVDSGMDPRRLSVVAYGEFRPVLPNTTPTGAMPTGASCWSSRAASQWQSRLPDRHDTDNDPRTCKSRDA